MPLFLDPVLFLFSLFLFFLFGEHDEFLAATSITLFNDVHHLTFFDCIFKSVIVFYDLQLERIHKFRYVS